MSKTLKLGIGLLPFPLVFLGLIALPGKAYKPLSVSKARALHHLSYPQSEHAMLSRFGQPLWSDDHYDWYPVSDSTMARVAYVGRRAQFVSFGAR